MSNKSDILSVKSLAKMGKLKIQIGQSKTEKHQLRFMAFIKDCSGENCPVKDMCEYLKTGRCTVEYNFLTNLYTDWIDEKDGIGDKLNQIQLDRIGIHLMPLYQQLVRFSMEILSLDGMTYTNKAGTQAEYPQYKAQRDVLKHINQELKDLGLEKIWAAKFGSTKDIPKNGIIDLEKTKRKGKVGSYEAKFGSKDDEDDDE